MAAAATKLVRHRALTNAKCSYCMGLKRSVQALYCRALTPFTTAQARQDNQEDASVCVGCVPSTQAACYTCPLRYKIFAAYLPQVCLASAENREAFYFAAHLRICLHICILQYLHVLA